MFVYADWFELLHKTNQNMQEVSRPNAH